MSSGTLVQFPLENEYKKNTGITPDEIKELREWMKTQPHLPEKYVTDLELILIHHCYDRDMEKSKQLIDTHYTMKTDITMLFKNRVFDAKIERVLNIMLITTTLINLTWLQLLTDFEKEGYQFDLLLQPLPRRTKDGYAIFYTRMIDCNPQNFVHVDSLRALVMSYEIWQYEEGTWPGLVMVSDLSGLTFGHFYRMQLSAQQQLISFLQDAFLAKIKQIHVLNAPGFFDKLLAMCKPFIKQSLLDLIYIHRAGATDLEQYFPLEALPIEDGGSWKTVEECKKERIAKFKASAEFFDLESKKRVDETKRPAKTKRTGFFSSFW